MPSSPKPFLPSGYMINAAFLPRGYELEQWKLLLMDAKYLNSPLADLFKSVQPLPGVRIRGNYTPPQSPQFHPKGAPIQHLSGMVMADDVFSQVKGLYEKTPTLFQVGAAVLAGIALFAFLPGGKK